MDYCQIVRPLLAYVSHLVRNQTERCGPSFPHASVREDLQHILLAVFHDPRAAGQDFDEAWFAVRCWLAETLPALPNGDDLCERLLDRPQNGKSEFFARLSRLLDHPDAENVVRVYATCLDLGFRGYYAEPGREGDLAGYRTACRHYLARETALDDGSAGAPAARSGSVHAAALLVPIGMTVMLYCVYRFLLSDLYVAVVG
ncbi:MAG: DotU family type IV/VI secretion system protein [Planctomycetaceae bacterium]|nr:DotU family type IV/VI secretion system protein [Planctomycetaceae bacterium]